MSKFPGPEGETHMGRAAGLRARIKEAVISNQPGLTFTVDLQAAALFLGIGVPDLTLMGEQEQNLKMSVDPQEGTLTVEMGILPLKMKQAAEFLVGLVAAEQISGGPEYLVAFGPVSRYLSNRIRGLNEAITRIKTGKNLDDLTLNFLELQAYALITGGNLEVPLPNLARAAAGR